MWDQDPFPDPYQWEVDVAGPSTLPRPGNRTQIRVKAGDAADLDYSAHGNCGTLLHGEAAGATIGS
jgi:hypothetical protein